MDNRKSVYQRVADKLDQMPNGFPATESGVEIKLLKKIFRDPVDAQHWLLLDKMPEPIAVIAERFGKSVAEAQDIVDGLMGKGLINAMKLEGIFHFHVQPFVIGMYEKNYLYGLVDKEYSELFEEYLPFWAEEYGSCEPTEVRVIPVGETVTTDKKIFVYDDARKIIEAGKSFRLLPCVCRHQKETIGEPCEQGHSVEEGCIGISYTDEVDEQYFPPMAKRATKEEALARLDRAAEAGLVHQSYNIEANNHFLCNCCSCCCGLIRGINEFKIPHMVTRSNFLAQIDADLCSACGTCADERCQFNAITEGDSLYEVDPEICTGCGVCVSACDDEAIILVSRPENELNLPLKDLQQFVQERTLSRTGQV
ncbi:MAG: 4Fe-4S binding protein [Deltaproteobacteria bacterium]|jgi:Na+-translocating ferredoxin:NAD+ oxidoreductase subunit B|nr:4Fe-4S binding protein [Deltaproteobacteria bacterium]MBT4637187.1 4Fe-4S binding protein [Deltaproteobacteria bacterium]MBT7891952.1 4Fe-4S binding protein [Deltaproteobacteria bacterium]